MGTIPSLFVFPFFNKWAGIIQWNEQYNHSQNSKDGSNDALTIPNTPLPSFPSNTPSHRSPQTINSYYHFQILNDFCWCTLKITFDKCCNRFIMRKNSAQTSKDDKINQLGQNKYQCLSLMVQGSNSDDQNPISQSIKKKRILKKPQSLLGRLRIESPLSSSPVFNLFNLIGLNQASLRDPESEESYFKTMFYMRVVERAELRRHALILQLKNTDEPASPIQYLINRYKSFGDRRCYELALAMERTAVKLQQERREGFTQQLMRSFDGEPLSRFIDSMAGETYMCKVAPNKLVISRALLEMLGEDPEAYAIELCKYKAPLREIISSELYSQIMTKTLEHLGLLCDYMKGHLSHDQLHAQTSVNFNDYIYNRHQKRIHCNFVLFMPTPQISCVQMREIISESLPIGSRCPWTQRKSLMDEHCQERRFKEAEVLKNIVKMPEGMLKDNERRVAGYKIIPNELPPPADT